PARPSLVRWPRYLALRPEALRRQVAPALPFRDGAVDGRHRRPDYRHGRLRRDEYRINFLISWVYWVARDLGAREPRNEGEAATLSGKGDGRTDARSQDRRPDRDRRAGHRRSVARRAGARPWSRSHMADRASPEPPRRRPDPRRRSGKHRVGQPHAARRREHPHCRHPLGLASWHVRGAARGDRRRPALAARRLAPGSAFGSLRAPFSTTLAVTHGPDRAGSSCMTARLFSAPAAPRTRWSPTILRSTCKAPPGRSR